MSLKIRLRQQGRKNHIVYRLVLTESRAPRDGKYIELLGWYNPYETEEDKNVCVHTDRVVHWLNLGAIVTEKAEALIKRSAPEIIEAYRNRQIANKSKECEKKRNRRKKREEVAHQ